MVAMKAATDDADDMVKALTREYNRARQTQITRSSWTSWAAPRRST